MPDEYIKSSLELIQATHQLTLTDQPPLRIELSRPLCRAIHHQTNIDTIDLSRIGLEDDGFRHLVDALATIRPHTLKLSGNHITGTGLAYLCQQLKLPPTPTAITTTATTGNFLVQLQELDLSYNPLTLSLSSDADQLSTILQHCPELRRLSLASTGLRQLDGQGRLIGLTHLDVGHNAFTVATLRKMLLQLNACKVSELRLAFSVERAASADSASLAKHLADFLQTGTLDALRILDISGWRLDDSDVYEVVQSLRRAQRLEALYAMSNQRLGAIGFGQMVRMLRGVGRLYLDGCRGVVRHLASENRGQQSTAAESACSWIRLPSRYADDIDCDTAAAVLGEFWTHLHGDRAIVSRNKTSIVLEMQPN